MIPFSHPKTKKKLRVSRGRVWSAMLTLGAYIRHRILAFGRHTLDSERSRDCERIIREHRFVEPVLDPSPTDIWPLTQLRTS